MPHKLRINLFGGIETLLNGQKLTFARTKSELLIAYLGCQVDNRKNRDIVENYFCPDAPDALRVIKQFALEPFPKEMEIVKYNRESVWLNLQDIALEVDIELYERAVSEEYFDVEEAVRLYQGPVLSGCRYPYIRAGFGVDDYKEDLVSALVRGSRIEPNKAVAYLRQALIIEPNDWRLSEILAEALESAGDREAALSCVYDVLSKHGSELQETDRRHFHRLRGRLQARPERLEYKSREFRESENSGRIRHVREPEGNLISKTFDHEIQPLIGREIDARLITGCYRDTTVVSVVGPPGIGKSAIARSLVFDSAVRASYPDGAFLVDLEYSKDLLTEVFDCFDLSIEPQQDSMYKGLSRLSAFIVIDHWDHAVEQVIQFVNRIRARSSSIHFLLLSSRLYNIGSQRVHFLRGLTYPDTMIGKLPDPEDLRLFTEYSAMRFLVREAQLVHQSAEPEIDPVLVSWATGICRRFVGNPQYIKMALTWGRYGGFNADVTREARPY